MNRNEQTLKGGKKAETKGITEKLQISGRPKAGGNNSSFCEEDLWTTKVQLIGKRF